MSAHSPIVKNGKLLPTRVGQSPPRQLKLNLIQTMSLDLFCAQFHGETEVINSAKNTYPCAAEKNIFDTTIYYKNRS